MYESSLRYLRILSINRFDKSAIFNSFPPEFAFVNGVGHAETSPQYPPGGQRHASAAECFAALSAAVPDPLFEPCKQWAPYKRYTFSLHNAFSAYADLYPRDARHVTNSTAAAATTTTTDDSVDCRAAAPPLLLLLPAARRGSRTVGINISCCRDAAHSCKEREVLQQQLFDYIRCSDGKAGDEEWRRRNALIWVSSSEPPASATGLANDRSGLPNICTFGQL